MTRKEIREWQKDIIPADAVTYTVTIEAYWKACKFIDFLLDECERLERNKDLQDYRKRDLLIEQLSARVKELEEGIKNAIHLLRDTGMTNQDKSLFVSLKKLIEK